MAPTFGVLPHWPLARNQAIAEGEIDAINEELDLIDHCGGSTKHFLCLTTEVIKRFTKVRDKTPYMDFMFTDVGDANTVFVKTGDTFIGAFESVARDRIIEPKTFQET